ncbi:hypothetical protein NDU88_004813 [Pleurodeles waltl]|uniref:Uncharacterized protein n=1 Tax=Pleurodeles waltl TaxID=8319 RepID=A0AAV7V5W7_PLEWA|nr:hypothetical protein NDU88_004813 [Pleurodeles waltl]
MECSDGGASDGRAPWGKGGRGAVTPRKSDPVETMAIGAPRRPRCGGRRWGDCGGGECSQRGDRILVRLLPSSPRCFPLPPTGRQREQRLAQLAQLSPAGRDAPTAGEDEWRC